MLPYLRADLPLVFIYNNIELFFEFLNRPEAHPLPGRVYVPNRQYSKGDRALLSLGDSKLTIVSAAVPHAGDLSGRLGFARTRYAYPANPSPWLCLDILQEPRLLEAIVDYAGPGRAVQLVPYATTPQFWQLVHKLRTDFGLTLHLPESPAESEQWLRDYIDSKAGFRALAARWLPNAQELLVEGIVCHSVERAAEAAHWFCRRGKDCIVKPDGGESGMGQHAFAAAGRLTLEAIFDELRRDPYLENDTLMVEEYIHSRDQLSPSLEVYVPLLGMAPPQITYLSNQLFLGLSDFFGLLISREQQAAAWYPPLAEAGLRLARELQALGYAGHFDIDTVVGDDGRVYLLELNSRRTAGTHVHEFAHHFFGADYAQQVALLSINKMKLTGITTFEALQQAVGDLQYPMGGAQRGVIYAVTSILPAGEFGCILVGRDTADVLQLHAALIARVGASGSGPT
jgi:hypothetical protein